MFLLRHGSPVGPTILQVVTKLAQIFQDTDLRGICKSDVFIPANDLAVVGFDDIEVVVDIVHDCTSVVCDVP